MEPYFAYKQDAMGLITTPYNAHKPIFLPFYHHAEWFPGANSILAMPTMMSWQYVKGERLELVSSFPAL